MTRRIYDPVYGIQVPDLDPMSVQDYSTWCGEVINIDPRWVCSRAVGHEGHHVAATGPNTPAVYVKHRYPPDQQLPPGF